MKRTAAGLVFILAITGLLPVVSANPEGWSGWPQDLPHIIINNDGSLSPPDVPIIRVGETYFLTGDIANYSIYVERDNVVIDGAGFTLQGNRSITPNGPIAAHGIAIQARNNVTIENLNITQFEQGIWNLGSTNVNITSNLITGCDQGITFVSNNFYNEGSYTYATAMSNTIEKNCIMNNGNGIDILGATYSNNIEQNIITNNVDTGIYFQCGGNNVTFNIISKNKKGVFIDYAAVNNTFLANNITLNDEGVALNMAENNVFCLNNFINNSIKVHFLSYPAKTVNIWDNGSIGNYWSDYQTKYPNASEVDSSGVWNTPYVIVENNTDHHPLMQPFKISSVTLDMPKWATIGPVVFVVSPESVTYNESSVPLTFTVDKTASWLSYSLDGKDNVTIAGNTTLTDLSSGLHNITVYAVGENGNVRASETIAFSIAEAKPVAFPTAVAATVFGASIAAVATGAVVYWKKRKR